MTAKQLQEEVNGYAYELCRSPKFFEGGAIISRDLYNDLMETLETVNAYIEGGEDWLLDPEEREG